MSQKTDSNLYTILFATGMVIIVGALLAFLASSLKDKIAENKRIEKQQNILYAMGINENDESSVEFVSKDIVGEEFNKYITKQLVVTGTNAVENDKAYLIDLKKESTLAKDKNYQRRLPLFVGNKDGKESYIVPVRGKGLWDAIWGYIALDSELVIQGVYFDHAGETPGLGSNIKERFFMDDFIGEHIMDGDTFKGVAVSKSNADPKNLDKTDNEVDAISGSTITGDGLAAMLKKDLKMYLPYLKTVNQ
ncbi:MAG: Na(+)-translocating NADH-quinone reductase subunit C [Lutibacter sp.]|uniref:Na(+)-translocating NADH-quinone reductase subunit C n=1 Tax=Lutibacter sp. TaxID=1925666 RepID=UPI0017980F3B|nr:Na(+)-translocating NADH-quinone reductase subunit C [Lutibacter sp.]MBT8318157.1 Na(+)-translocating NADH-quinone reductase subunit C [Lutibacter sp.]NNJ59017.1 Na(+)-translocating NADH-quinone reductase subunit C [Lutibacter sp.]